DEFEHALGDGVVELVELDEVAALDVPVRLLELRVEVEGVREPRVQQPDDLVASLVTDVDPRGEGAPSLHGHGFLLTGGQLHTGSVRPSASAKPKMRFASYRNND